MPTGAKRAKPRTVVAGATHAGSERTAMRIDVIRGSQEGVALVNGNIGRALASGAESASTVWEAQRSIGETRRDYGRFEGQSSSREIGPLSVIRRTPMSATGTASSPAQYAGDG